MKTSVRAQLTQGVNLTPQLLQSIRLLQLTAPQLELELRQALDRNPMLEPVDDDEAGEADAVDTATDAELEAAAWDELPDPVFLSGGGTGGADDDACARIAAGESTDWRVRLLQELSFEWGDGALRQAQWWLDHCDDHGLLEGDPGELAREGAAALTTTAAALEAARQRLLHGAWTGVAAASAAECLLAQLASHPADATRSLAERMVGEQIHALAAHDNAALAHALGADADAVAAATALVLSLRPSPVEPPAAEDDGHVIPDVSVRFLGGQWRVALNGRATPRIRIAAHCEQALAHAPGDQSVLRGLLDEARWLVRGIAMRNDTLLRTVQVLVERQRAFLERGEEAIAPLTLREVADAIGMHESTVSRITSGKYIQTPRGTFELKRLFAVRLEGAAVSGAAVKAMVKRLIDAEPGHAPLADDVIAGLLARRGVRIARRTVAKYRDQLSIPSARQRCKPALAA
ncbi:RNA polymerase sigma54 factor [Lysobacter arseniciresistens ZS79]|uniref:RNA polymerase sigma-54 factor n=1 Tax=Lysobacter arseniciresistens ZS79 TaxID=913325 RepID=A0A0A0F4F8_9GAMM|nr:RNA polymerase factor sigma-54 [Lysobacter arseniciresistens]KGM57360.1 RNA polymerase sigma54 factor [Lysobacter arseniciresistens ZS79]